MPARVCAPMIRRAWMSARAVLDDVVFAEDAYDCAEGAMRSF